jgi:hypothetical protein
MFQFIDKGNLLYFRDEMMAEALTSRIDPHAGNLARAILSLIKNYDAKNPTFSQNVTLNEIRSRIQKQFHDATLLKFLEDYLQVVSKYQTGLANYLVVINQVELFTVNIKYY